MKDIKFRAWDSQLESYTYSGWKEKTWAIFAKRTNCPRYIIEQQSFGLTDKDNTLIYEGDIADSIYGIGTVILTERGFMFEFDTDTTDLWSMATGIEGEEFEIIDNIHEVTK